MCKMFGVDGDFGWGKKKNEGPQPPMILTQEAQAEWLRQQAAEELPGQVSGTRTPTNYWELSAGQPVVKQKPHEPVTVDCTYKSGSDLVVYTEEPPQKPSVGEVIGGIIAVILTLGTASCTKVEQDPVIAELYFKDAKAINYIYEKVKNLEFTTPDGLVGKIVKKGEGDNVSLAFQIGSQIFDIPMKVTKEKTIEYEGCHCNIPKDPDGPCPIKIGNQQTLIYINDIDAAGKPECPDKANGKNILYSFAVNEKDVPLIEFQYIDANGKQQKMSVSIGDNKELNAETIEKYLRNVVKLDIPEGATFKVGKNQQGERGAFVTWQVPVGKTADEIEADFQNSDDWKNVQAQHSDAKFEYCAEDGRIHVTYNVEKSMTEDEIKAEFEASKTWKDILAKHPDAKYTYENGTMCVTYDVTTTEPKSKKEIIDDFCKKHPEINRDQVSYNEGDDFVTVTYPGKDYTEDEIKAEFEASETWKDILAKYPDAKYTYENGKVTVKWNLSDVEVVTNLNKDPNSIAEYSIDENGNVVETFTGPDGKKYTHVNGANMVLNDKARADFEPVMEFLELDSGIILDYKTCEISSWGENSWSRSLSIGLTENNLDKAEYVVTMDGHTTKGVPVKQEDGSIQIGDITFSNIGSRDIDGTYYKKTMDVKFGDRSYTLHYDDYPSRGRCLNQIEHHNGNQEVNFKVSDKVAHSFDIDKADNDYESSKTKELTENVATHVDPTTKNFDVETEKEVTEPHTEGPFDVKTTKTEEQTDLYDVDGAKTELKTTFFPEHLTYTRDKAKEYFENKEEDLINAYNDGADVLKYKFLVTAEGDAKITIL